MRKKNGFNKLLLFLLIMLFVAPLIYFLIYPNYDKLLGPIERFDVQKIAEEFTFQILTDISPTKEKILDITDTTSIDQTIEESIEGVIFTGGILEGVETKISISSVGVEGLIFEGSSAKTMNKGFWHFPASKLPGEKGNSVIIGHRYAKLPPSKDTFFNLDKVRVGDKIVVEQIDNSYTYIVTDTRVVEKNDISVLRHFDDYRLTLITCTPLWSSNQRLVVVAKLDKLYKNT